MTRSSTTGPSGRATEVLARLLGGGSGTVFALIVVIFAFVFVMNPSFAQPRTMVAFFLLPAAGVVVLAIGQYFVIVSGELDLSVGSLVGAQVVIAARLLEGDDSRTFGVLALMVGFGALVGLVNGLVVTLLRVPSIITTLGMMLILFGAIRLWTGGAPTGELSTRFRILGRDGISDVPVIGQLPWAVLVLVVVGALAVWVMRTPYGRTLMAVGDNDVTVRFSGARVWQIRTAAFVACSLLTTLAAILIGGRSGLTAQVGQGLEFTAITAVVLGGIVLGGGRGTVVGAIGGALALQALFVLFNQFGMPSTLNPAVQGLIIIAAVAYAARPRTGSSFRLLRRGRDDQRDTQPAPPTGGAPTRRD
ncbi:ABC transporter permease [Spiractinospora alimapuensis]|uniref:ABC transporter permease n=1 Tax=Spiractinospora alimapuensis TaxID=2820884 RepID=UPI001F3E6A1A|nr:ABC transporter permease [Spiractinospora alimapuensis]QVQ53340.1 ABC transporter permease [Spiractinospora alimapuensis]